MFRRRRAAKESARPTEVVVSEVPQTPEVIEEPQDISVGKYILHDLHRVVGNLRFNLALDAIAGPEDIIDGRIISDLARLSVDPTELWQSVTAELVEIGTSHCQQKVTRNNRSIAQQGKVSIIDPADEGDSRMVVTIPADSVDVFQQCNVDALRAIKDIVPPVEDEPIEEIREVTFLGLDSLVTIMDKIVKLTPFMDTTNQFIHALAAATTAEWIEKVAYLPTTTGNIAVKKIEVNRAHPDFKKLVRCSRQLVDELQKCIDNPTEYAASLIVATMAENFTVLAEQAFDRALIDKNTALYDELQLAGRTSNRRERRQHRDQVATRIGTEATKGCVPCPDEPESPQSTQNVENDVVTHELKTVQVIDAKLTLSWINNGEMSPYQIEEMTDGQHPVYVVRALDPKLKKLSDKVRSKEGKKSAEDFDTILNLLAHRVSMQDNPSIGGYKTLSKERSESFSAVGTINYNPDVSNNAKRVYVTYGESITAFTDGIDEQLKADVPVVFLLAEADKQTQIEVLQRITGSGRSYLRAAGAGAV